MANSFYLDASALAERYVPEPGSAQVNAILDTVPSNRLFVLNIGMGELVSILVRKRNAGVISQAYFVQALVNFDGEIVHASNICKVSVTRRLVTTSFPLIVYRCDCFLSLRLLQIDALEQLPKAGRFQRQPDPGLNIGKPNFNPTPQQTPAILDESANGQGANKRQLGQIQDNE